MALALPDRWIWDSWYVWEGDVCHAFYLCASRGLRDPEERHRAPSIGHAVSKDLVNWRVLPDALSPSQTPAFDSWTTWTGSVVKGDDGIWHLFYTGSSREDGGLVQRIGMAVSPDLATWTKCEEPIVEANPEWYETLEQGDWPDQAWRDPWVFRSGGDQEWAMLITARNRLGNPETRGTLGFATSNDLKSWTVRPPTSRDSNSFGQMEVFQFAVVDGIPVLVFSCGWRELSQGKRREVGKLDLTYSVVVDPSLEDVDFTGAEPIIHEPLYAGRLLQNPKGEWFLLGFWGYVGGRFIGEISDPIRVSASVERGVFSLEAAV